MTFSSYSRIIVHTRKNIIKRKELVAGRERALFLCADSTSEFVFLWVAFFQVNKSGVINIKIILMEIFVTILSRQRKTGWFAPLLFAYGITRFYQFNNILVLHFAFWQSIPCKYMRLRSKANILKLTLKNVFPVLFFVINNIIVQFSFMPIVNGRDFMKRNFGPTLNLLPKRKLIARSGWQYDNFQISDSVQSILYFLFFFSLIY